MTGASWQPDPTGRHDYRYWDGAQWTDHVSDNGVVASDPDLTPRAPEAALQQWSARPDHPTPSSGIRMGTVAMVIGAVVIAVGSIGTWATVSAGILSRSISGTDGDGTITLVLAFVILLMALVTAKPAPSGGLLAVSILAAIAAGAIAAYDATNVSDKVASVEASSSLVSASVGWGLYAVIGGAVIGVVASIMRVNEADATRKA